MTDFNDGKIHGWNGGDCPVHRSSIANIWCRAGGVYTLVAGDYIWDHVGHSDDIIAFRVVKEYREPKTIWVNEYADGDVYAHLTKERAESSTSISTIYRIAVKYQEVIEND